VKLMEKNGSAAEHDEAGFVLAAPIAVTEPVLYSESMDFQTRVKWQNDSKTQEVFPLRTYTPGSLADLLEIVGDARRQRRHL